MSDRSTNSQQKKLILRLIHKAALSGLQSGIRNILSVYYFKRFQQNVEQRAVCTQVM